MEVNQYNVKKYTQEVSKRIGKLIQDARTKKRISLRELSRRTGVCIASISDIENANKLPRLLIILRLAIALEIPFEQIIGKAVI